VDAQLAESKAALAVANTNLEAEKRRADQLQSIVDDFRAVYDRSGLPRRAAVPAGAVVTQGSVVDTGDGAEDRSGGQASNAQQRDLCMRTTNA
jgi:hypothetical protein